MLIYRFETFDHDGIWCPKLVKNHKGGTPSKRAANALRFHNMQFDNPGLEFHEYENCQTISFLEYLDDKLPHPSKESWSFGWSKYHELIDHAETRFAFSDFNVIRKMVGLEHRKIKTQDVHEQYEWIFEKQMLALWAYEIPEDRILARAQSQMMVNKTGIKPIGVFPKLLKNAMQRI